MQKGKISNLLRSLRLMHLVDRLRYYNQKLTNRYINKEFKKNNTDVILPSDYLMYESFQVNYKKYYTDGIDTAKWIEEYFSKYKELKNLKILDWGCGPGRIIRHLPKIIGNNCEFYGTDYNENSIKWCAENLPGIKFNKNDLKAKLPYPDNFFDVIYGISIFTHLSEQMHYDWCKELHRILNKNGILFLTTQGNIFNVKFTDIEKSRFETGKLIVRGQVKEGHRTYSAFQPKEFMIKLFDNVEILEHVEKEPESNWLPQDIWIVRKIV